jgi:hypothetical protein
VKARTATMRQQMTPRADKPSAFPPPLNRKSRAAQTADPPRLFLEIDVSEFPARCGRTTKQAGYSSTDHGGGKRRCVTLFCHIDCAVACYFGR